MKKITNINRVDIQKLFLNLDNEFQKLNIDFNLSEYYGNYYNGKDNSKFYIISSDVEKLTKQLILYFYQIIKNFKFVSLYDEIFVESFKFFVKDENEFYTFLNLIHLSPDDFFQLSIYICPSAFTSNLLKFIKANYINQ